MFGGIEATKQSTRFIAPRKVAESDGGVKSPVEKEYWKGWFTDPSSTLRLKSCSFYKRHVL